MPTQKKTTKKTPVLIHDRITYFRKLAGYTQYEMAAKIKMSGGNYGKIERGDIGVPFTGLELIATACKIPVTTLISQRTEELEALVAEKDKKIVELQQQIINLLSDKNKK
jgi:transcriptional regulator with XRE-family HTH domain